MNVTPRNSWAILSVMCEKSLRVFDGQVLSTILSRKEKKFTFTKYYSLRTSSILGQKSPARAMPVELLQVEIPASLSQPVMPWQLRA